MVGNPGAILVVRKVESSRLRSVDSDQRVQED